MLYDKDADLGLLEGKDRSVIGFGSQGHAHSQNLRIAGVRVRWWRGSWYRCLGPRGGRAGFEVADANAAAAMADVIMMVVPTTDPESGLRERDTRQPQRRHMLMSPTVNIHYNQIIRVVGSGRPR